jgi:DNA-binding NarL/FixJ family response regulator
MKAILAGRRNETRDAVGRALSAGGWVGPTVDEAIALPAQVRAANGVIVVVTDRWPGARLWLEASADLGVPAAVVDANRTHEADIRVAGARGLLGWPMTSARLAAALRAIDAGFEVRDMNRERVDTDTRLALQRSPRLSPREREILAHVAAGASNKQIAAACGVSLNTVKFHLAHLFTKLGADSRAEAVATAIARGELAI